MTSSGDETGKKERMARNFQGQMSAIAILQQLSLRFLRRTTPAVVD
jgi:hypothetical protein